MSKREASMFAAAGIDIDAPRAKRRKENPNQASSSSGKVEGGVADSANEGQGDGKGVEATDGDRETVRESGLRLWQSVKDAVNKEGRMLSHDFMRLPSKRQYPDYYVQIKHPISLDEIKTHLDTKSYDTLEAVRQDLETCFRNAKRYNMKESQIWKDAKHLHKLVTKEYNKMTGKSDAVEGGEDGEDGPEHAGGSDDEAGKKKKAPNMNRLLKSRLQKLVEKTDDTGRVLSTEFMELPNRKQWPIYYKTIKRPQCLEAIFKHLKRKEYPASVDFANDVELVFSNALEFNQEHTQIWEDALVLRDYFRQLMADLPQPHAIPAYTVTESSSKLKIKMPSSHPQPHSPPQPVANGASLPTHNVNTSGTLMLRVPAHHASASSSIVIQPTIPTERSSPSKVVPVPAPVPAVTPQVSTNPIPVILPSSNNKTTTTTPSVTGSLQATTFTQPLATFATHYPNATYQPPVAPLVLTTPAASTSLPNTNEIKPRTVPTTNMVGQTIVIPSATVDLKRSEPLASQSPAPSISQNLRQLKYVSLRTKPLGRRLDLDYRDGVKTWAVRLGTNETGVRIANIQIPGGAAGGGDAEDSEDEQDEGEPREGEDVEIPKKRGRGRPRKKGIVPAPSVKGKGKASAKKSEVQVKLNGILIKGSGRPELQWDIELPVGSNVLAIGEQDGLIWKVFLERMTG